MAAQQVAVDLDGTGEFGIAELVERKGGWSTVRLADGSERKVRNSQLAMTEDGAPVEDLTDEDDDEFEGRAGDVFPVGVRERYASGVKANGKKFIDCGDSLAVTLRDASLHQVAKLAEEHVLEPRLSAQGWIDLYTVDRPKMGKKPLNPGMVRMNIGNRIRAAIKRAAEEG